nr:integrase, catalytic region, zinc finger, CCHC-type, peptidase aspartic, catalytic [Tanacetum cinerariifolium]
LDTFSSVRRHKHSSVIWKKKGSSNTSNVDLSSISHSKLNKDVKRYSRKDLLSCNNSYLGEISSAYVCNDAMNVSCNSRLYDSFDENNLFIFDDVSVRNSQVSKMPFRKKPRDSLNVRSKMIDGYGDVVIGSIPIKKVYYVEGLGHNLFSVGKFCDKDLEVTFRKSTCFVRTEDGVDFLTDEASEVIISFIKKTQVNLQLEVQLIMIMKSSTMNVETSNVDIPSNEEEVFHESSELFQEESSSSSLDDDVHQSLEEVAVPVTNINKWTKNQAKPTMKWKRVEKSKSTKSKSKSKTKPKPKNC